MFTFSVHITCILPCTLSRVHIADCFGNMSHVLETRRPFMNIRSSGDISPDERIFMNGRPVDSLYPVVVMNGATHHSK